MENKSNSCQHAAATSRRELKRKAEAAVGEDSVRTNDELPSDSHMDLRQVIIGHVHALNSANSYSKEKDRLSVEVAMEVLSALTKKDDVVTLIVDCGAIPALVKHLHAPSRGDDEESNPRPYELQIQSGSALILGLFATKPEHQQLIVDTGALPHLVNLLKSRSSCPPCPRAVNDAIRRAANAIAHLARDNSRIKSSVRVVGGIPPLVELLKFDDPMVQRSAARALRTLAYKNDENKSLIVECNALPMLILMLKSEDSTIQDDAVGAIGNMVHSSPNIKKEVLAAGALQPVIRLLSSCYIERQKEAALLIGQFATTDSDCKAHIVQRGALPPLIKMLQSTDDHLQEISTFALGRLAQDTHNQAGIAQNNGIMPLLKLLESKNGSVQHNAAFALYGLANNEDNVASLICSGGIQRLQNGEFIMPSTMDCVCETLKKIEEKIHGQVLSHLLYMMRVGVKKARWRVALSLAHLCSSKDHKAIFIDNKGLDLLLELLISTKSKRQRYASKALYRLAYKVPQPSFIHETPLPPTPQIHLGERYVNHPSASDITFLVDGKRFYAHKICLVASSDAFRAMFDGGFREKYAKDIEIPNIRWEVFELMMRYIYTGCVDFNPQTSVDLLRAADQYLLDGLKRLCEKYMAWDISVDSVRLMYEISDTYNAASLRNSCILFVLEMYERLHQKPWYRKLIQRILPEARNYFVGLLSGRPSVAYR